MPAPKKLITRIFLTGALIIFSLCVFVTCNTPFGFGDQIDWEPPVLLLDDEVKNPFYVRLGARLFGTVTDNTGVDRVIMRNAETGAEMAKAKLDGEEWEIILDFTEEQNGQKIAVEIVAYDKGGNSGEPSIKSVTLIIDIYPPVFEDLFIARTSMRTADFEQLNVLKALEETDKHGERSANVNRYQNGWFNISGKISEKDTRITEVSLFIYDSAKPDTLLYSPEKTPNLSDYAPQWLIKEEDLLFAGEKLWPGYTNTFNNGARYYYKVIAIAKDKSDNVITEEKGYFCLWKEGDVPKGIFDPIIGSVVVKGSTLPVEFFDDDSLSYAYAILLRKEQWDGYKTDDSGNQVAPVYYLNGADLKMPSGYSNDQKLDFLTDKLLTETEIWDWDENLTEEILKGNSVNEKIVYLQTGNNDSDYGDFVLFTLTGDKKLYPHPDNYNKDTYRARFYELAVIDENEPLIVFDTVDITGGHPPGHLGHDNKTGAATGNSPEENTFPKLTNGQFFEINGYTLREDSNMNNDGSGGVNRVLKFRLAWIPYTISADGPDSRISEAQNELKKANGFTSGVRNGIHYWDLSTSLVEGTFQEIGDSGKPIKFRKQVFRKQFDILGLTNDSVLGVPHFTHNGKRENNTKLFIFFAEDNLEHQVYRQLRLLGNTKPPDLAVYDITSRNIASLSPPRLSSFDSDSNGEISASERAAYETALKSYQSGAYGLISSSVDSHAVSESDRTIAVNYYPRGTQLKYWARAEKSGDLSIQEITMNDITSSNYKPAGNYNNTARALSYVEELPEVTQRVFRFTAKDTLDNEITIQRTAVVTNAAMLMDITSLESDGTYPVGKEITLHANFSSPVYWTSSSAYRPKLNIRITRNGAPTVVQLDTITGSGGEHLFLEFKYIVHSGDSGRVETMYTGITGGGSPQEPITLENGVSINDYERKDSAFIPGNNQSGFDWINENGSLQKNRNILLKGTPPSITGFALQTKAAYSGTTNRYLTLNDALGFNLFATPGDQIYTEAVTTNGVPRIRFQIVQDGNDAASGTYYALWQRSVSGNGMYFNINIDSSIPNGEVVNLVLDETQGKIVDSAGNKINIAGYDYLNLPSNARVYIDRTAPPAPSTTLDGTTIGTNPDTVMTFNKNDTPLVINQNAQAPYAAGEYHLLEMQYSFNNGLSWTNYTSAVPSINSGMYVLQSRYRDRAGNVGAVTRQSVHVNAKFPELKSITVDKVNGYYIPGTNGTLTFSLAFEEPVYIQDSANVTITLRDRIASPSHNAGGTANSYEITLAAPVAGNPTESAATNTIHFPWVLTVNTKEMLNGLYVSAVNFTGLRDQFKNAGLQSTASTFTQLTISNTGSVTSYTCNNLTGDKLFADTIHPRVSSITPANANIVTGNVSSTVMSSDNRTITITFSEKVEKGGGIITVKPRAGFAVPPVMENEGYYVDQAGTRYSDNADGRTYVAGFSDIYNSGLTAAHRNYLTLGTTAASAGAAPTASVRPSSVTDSTNPSLSRLVLNERTGHSYGPYMKMPHGLREGSGWTGSYTSSTAAEPAPSSGLMVPDTAQKWVLDYQYLIHDTAAGAVTNIRTALEAAKFRQQEIEVGSSNVTLNTAGTVVTIKLPQPLLKGLQWELVYSAGTFTDTAGNNAPACPDPAAQGANGVGTLNGYWFRSYGVQDPVVRVNRKSSDARTGNWHVPTGRAYNEPAATGTAAGWGMNDFNRAYYRIETETKDAQIYYSTFEGTVANGGSVTGAWTGTVLSSNSGASMIVAASWQDTLNATAGQWVMKNLVRRRGTSSYTVSDNGYDVTRAITADHRGLRSYNRDITKTDLLPESFNVASPETAITSGTELYFTYEKLQASKNYITAFARVDNSGAGAFTSTNAADNSQRGYEGVFRSVVALNQASFGGNLNGASNTNNPIMLQGSNIKNGMPSIAGFPVRDAEETGDNRFIKLYFRDGYSGSNTTMTAGQFYWVSYEILSLWYALNCARRASDNGNTGGTHMGHGDVNNYLLSSYGELTYSNNQR